MRKVYLLTEISNGSAYGRTYTEVKEKQASFLQDCLSSKNQSNKTLSALTHSIFELFNVLSGGTHGKAGKYEYNKLVQVKKCVEKGIIFLCEILHKLEV